MENLKTISELVNIKSFDKSENKEIIDYLVEKFEPYADEVVKVKNPNSNKNNLVVKINCKNQSLNNVLVLSGHIDTVTANEKEYKTNPYLAELIDGKLYGLGVIDMKCFFASIIDNLEKIKSIKYPTIVAITCDEETQLNGVGAVCKFLKSENIIPRLTIVGEPTSLNFCNSSKCCFEYEIKTLGKSCHSSQPENGINSNYVLAKLVLEIEKLNGLLKNTTLNVGKVSGGRAVNIVPDCSSLSFDVRSDENKKVKKILRILKQKISELKNEYSGCEIKLKCCLKIPAFEKKESEFLNQEMLKFKINQKDFLGGCEAGYFQKLGGEVVVFGVGDLSLAHKPNEFMIVSDFEKYNKLLIEILKDFVFFQTKNTP